MTLKCHGKITMTYVASLRIWISEGREQHHDAMSILFSDLFSWELPKRKYLISYRNLHNDNAVF